MANNTWVVSVVLCFLLSFVHITKAGQDTVTKAKELNEVEKLLNKLNKPAVKSLKMRPRFLPKGKKSSESETVAQLWHQSGSCPEGTIPIRRTTKDDIMRASSFQRFGQKDNNTIPNLSESLYSSASNHEYATAEVRKDKYYGAKAFINIWKTKVQQRNEFSLSQIWVMNQDDTDNVESIEAGWQIHPMLYGDDRPRLFAYWTSDSYERTGCYNLQCSGFVQVSNAVALGTYIEPLSVYDGTQYGISIVIRKVLNNQKSKRTAYLKRGAYWDPGTRNWWMQFHNTYVGYWPASMFDRLSESASIIQWGGEVVNRKSNGRHTTTEMGSGYFPRAGFGRASYFRDVSIFNENNYLVTPNYFSAYASKPRCYDIVLNGYSNDWGAHFYYGGPGRNSYCPI